MVDVTPNRLSREKSPYLLQHAHNPVDWYPWGEEAFAKAVSEDKPVLLSVGYSTCHWCHVMEEESFSDPKTAALMNDGFVPIKVDREERPDIDALYMRYVTATTGGGGWPMTVFLTPDKKPFYGGTYFPPEDRYGMPGFPSLLTSIREAWKERRGEILESADSAVGFLSGRRPRVGGIHIQAETFRTAYEQLNAGYDAEHGGFGRAPKFPMGHTLSWVLRHGFRTGLEAPTRQAVDTLKAIAAGGIQDHLAGGFHRYSTDRQWRVPHFEKMLYDQAMLSYAYLEAFQVTGDPDLADTARRTLDYVLSEMTHPEGAFYSAQDADSADPAENGRKREGAFYVWTESEIRSLLSAEDAALFLFYYGIRPDGNAIQDPHGEFRSKNVFYRAHTLEAAASHAGVSVEEARKSLVRSARQLLEVRSKRPRPFLDDKILVDWNGLMIAAFALASRVLDEPAYLRAAERAADFIQESLCDKEQRLLHRYRGGEAAIPALLEDHAFLIHGYLELYRASWKTGHLARAVGLADRMLAEFYDEKEGGFFMTSASDGSLPIRTKDLHDGAIPSGTSMAAYDLVRLGRLTGEVRFERAAAATLEACAEDVSLHPSAYTQALIAADLAVGPSREIVIVAGERGLSTSAIVQRLNRCFMPDTTVLLKTQGSDAAWAAVPFVASLRAVDGKTTVYMCRDRACGLPVTDEAGLDAVLETQRVKQEN